MPGWVLGALDELPEDDARVGAPGQPYENAVLDLVEAGLLQRPGGGEVHAVVVDVDEKTSSAATSPSRTPPSRRRVTSTSDLPLGEEVTVELAEADPTTRTVEFRLV